LLGRIVEGGAFSPGAVGAAPTWRAVRRFTFLGSVRIRAWEREGGAITSVAVAVVVLLVVVVV